MDKMKTDAGSLLTSGCFSDWTYSAIARMSGGEAVANVALRSESFDKERFCKATSRAQTRWQKHVGSLLA